MHTALPERINSYFFFYHTSLFVISNLVHLSGCLLGINSKVFGAPLLGDTIIITVFPPQVLIELAQYREQPVSEAMAWKLVHQMGAVGYVESSALTQKNLKEVFDQAIVAALDDRSPLYRNSSKRGSKRRGGRVDSFGKGEQRTVDYGDEGRTKSGWRRLCCFS